MTKSITVKSNDKQNPSLKLKISGMVETFAEITPNRVRLTGKAGDLISTTAIIKPKKEYPFKLLEAKAKQGTNFSFELENKTIDGKVEHGEEY